MNREFTSESIHAANKAKGFYDMELTILSKMETSEEFAMFFTPEERQAVARAFQMQRIALMVSELGEAVESLRKDKTAAKAIEFTGIEVTELDPNDAEDVAYYKAHFKDTVEDEKADTVIRIYDDAGRIGYDLDAHIRMKLAVNAGREHMHGKNC